MNQTKLSIGHRTSDFCAKIVRSWSFVMVQMAFIAVWIIINQARLFNFDPAPFDLLRLVLTIESSFIGSILLMSQSRQSTIDRKMSFNDYIINWAAKKELDQMLPLIKADHSKMEEVLVILKRETLSAHDPIESLDKHK